ERRCSSAADRSYANVRNGWGSATPPAVVLLHPTSSDLVCGPVSSWSWNVIALPLPAIHCEPMSLTKLSCVGPPPPPPRDRQTRNSSDARLACCAAGDADNVRKNRPTR